jgi:DNA-binding LytR/AlgR family response regulator
MRHLHEKIKNRLPFLYYKFDLSSTNRRFSLVFFTTISAFLFLNFFEPFGLYYDKTTPAQEVFVELFVAMTFGFVILIISQFVLRPLFNFFKSTIWGVLGWFLLEALMVAITWSFLDAAIKSKQTSFTVLWLENIVAYSVIMFLPYFIFIGYTYFKDKLLIIKDRETTTESAKQTISLKDESGETRLILDIENLLFIRSADNYIEVNHLENNIHKKTLIRNSIKKLETELYSSPVIRCHRSYMLNTKKIESAIKTSSGFSVRIQHFADTTIPVSRSYISELKKYATSFN